MTDKTGNQEAPFLPDNASNFSQVKRVLWQILALNLVVAAAKIIVGLVTGSISMVADGFHSTMDSASNIKRTWTYTFRSTGGCRWRKLTGWATWCKNDCRMNWALVM